MVIDRGNILLLFRPASTDRHVCGPIQLYRSVDIFYILSMRFRQMQSILPHLCRRAPLAGVVYHSLGHVLPPFEAAVVWHVERLAPVIQTVLGYLEEESDAPGYGPGRSPVHGRTAEATGA